MPAEQMEELGPLPAGRHGFSREQVTHNQRERLIAALAQVVTERGYNTITIADVTAAAQVSRRTFYEHFTSKEQCFLAAFEVVVEHLGALIGEAIVPIPDWPHRIAAGLRTLLAFFTAEPQLARLCMVDSLMSGPVISEHYSQVIHSFAPLLRPGREERRSVRALPDSTEDTLLGALASAIARSIMAGDGAKVETLAPDLTAFVLTPYLGPAEAREIAEESTESKG